MVIHSKNRKVRPDQIVNGLADELYFDSNGTVAGMRAHTFPRVNIYEERDSWVFTFEVPGVDPKQIELSLKQMILTVKGRRSSFYNGEESRIHERESCVGECSFTRSIRLPAGVEPESVHARLVSGMLVVKIAKSEKEQEKTIEIRCVEESENES